MGNHDQSVELWFEGNLDYLPLYLYSPAGCSEMCVTAGGTPPPNSKTSIGRRASRWDHNKQTDKQKRNKKLERVLLQEHRRAKSEISRRCTRTTSQGRRLLPGEKSLIRSDKSKMITDQTKPSFELAHLQGIFGAELNPPPGARGSPCSTSNQRECWQWSEKRAYSG